MTNIALDELPDLDVRTVAIIWGDGEPRPQLIISENLDEFVALGLLRAAVIRLERKIPEYLDIEGWDDDYEDYEDDDDDDLV